MINKIEQFLKDNEINKSDLARETGIPYTTIDGFYKKGTENVKLSTLKKLAKYMQCTIDYLVENETSPKFAKENLIFLSGQEEMHIKKYRVLDERGKRTVDKILEEQYEYCNIKSQKS